MPNILVTGGAGNIGTNLCNELRSRGHKVISCDLYNTERIDYIRCDVRNYRQLQYVFDEFINQIRLFFLQKRCFQHDCENFISPVSVAILFCGIIYFLRTFRDGFLKTVYALFKHFTYHLKGSYITCPQRYLFWQNNHRF